MNISDVEKQTGLPATAIRYYENRGLVRVKRKANGYRSYDEETVRVLSQIRQLRRLGINLADIHLWRDGVVTFNELIVKRLRTMDDDSKKSQNCRQLCEALLRGEEAAETLSLSEEFREEESGEAEIPEGPLLLGIDIGTTSLSAQVMASTDGYCVQTYNLDHCSALPLEGFPDAYAADARRLIERTLALIASLTETYPGIASIGITGQMHGIVCIDDVGTILSPLYTWQNEFGLRAPDGTQTICDEIRSVSGEVIPTGYGITTCYALRKLGLLPERTARIVTIMDLLAARLCGTEPMLHPTNAAAMGAFDLKTNEFRPDVLEKLQIPRALLPEVVKDYTVAGSFVVQGRSIPVAVSIGDNQAGVFGSVADDRMALINVGTSSQISVISNDPASKGVEVRPYFDGKYLHSGAALCGGRAYAVLKNLIRSILADFGHETGEGAVYEYLNRAAECGIEQALSVDTRFCGTRADPALRGSITNIGLQNFTPEALSAGILRGIVHELYEMYTAMYSANDAAITIASGNAIRRNPVLRKICAAYFGQAPLVPLHTEEAAFGAALYGGVAAGLLTRTESYTRIHYTETKEEV